MMLLSCFSLLAAIILIRAIPVTEKCNLVTIKNSPVAYEKEVLKTDVDRPYLLALDHSSNTLYFSYNSEETGFSIAAKLDLKDKEFKVIRSVRYGFAPAVDSTNSEVYIGGNDGIYKYDSKNDTAELYAAIDVSVYYLYFHGDLYYTDYSTKFPYVVKNGESIRVKDLEHLDTKVDMFVIDNDDDIFYTNETGIYGQQKGKKTVELYKSIEGFERARGLTTDKNGKVYVCTIDGIYVVNKDTKKCDRILEEADLYGIVFDSNNNLIYSDNDNIYILKPTENSTCEV